MLIRGIGVVLSVCCVDELGVWKGGTANDRGNRWYGSAERPVVVAALWIPISFYHAGALLFAYRTDDVNLPVRLLKASSGYLRVGGVSCSHGAIEPFSRNTRPSTTV